MQALAMQKTTPEKLGRLLIDLKFVTERDVLAAYAQQLNIPVYDPERVVPDPAVTKVIPDHLVQRYNIVPLRRNGSKLQVAMQDPTNVFALDDIRLVTGFDIEPMLATPDDIATLRRGKAPVGAPTGGSSVTEALAQAASAPTAVGDTKEDKSTSNVEITSILDGLKRPDSPDPNEKDDEDVANVEDEAPIIRMVNVILQNAIKEGASDIHVEPDRKQVRIRYRIDGVLYEMMTLPKFSHAPLTSRLKIMSDMNIAERRIPQDGRLHIRHEKRDFDMRVNMLPTVFGEKCCMRILDQSSVVIGLGRLGFTNEMMTDIESLIIKPNGCVLVTGPTGSGKTTTLYSMLHKLNSVERNINTVEDPVEYQLPGVNQVSVNRKSGLTFALAMRAFLRQDPDIVMVGEIRDLETAEIAIQAALTGHMVLSTLHTNDAPATIVRLTDMGVEPFLISASVIGVIAQRLARRLCDKCKEPIDPPVEALLQLGMKEEELQGATFFKPVGCENCSNRGYRGRCGVYELLIISEELAELIVRRAPLSEITQTAMASGMTSLVRDGLMKARNGVTTVEDVLRVVKAH